MTDDEIPAPAGPPASDAWPWAVPPEVAEGEQLPDHLSARDDRFPAGLLRTEKGWNE